MYQPLWTSWALFITILSLGTVSAEWVRNWSGSEEQKSSAHDPDPGRLSKHRVGAGTSLESDPAQPHSAPADSA